MINKLVDEANAEATQKDFCDTEKAKTFKPKDEKANAEATKIRNEERVTNEQAAKDYADGAQAVEDAIGVLQDYYSGASLLQGKGIHPGVKKLGLLQNKQRQPSLGSAKAGAADMIM